MSTRQSKSILVAVVVLTGISQAVPVEWPVSAGGNGHFYEVVSVPSGILWTDAKSSAETMGGYLATITSEAEDIFVWGLLDSSHFGDNPWGPWLGGFQPDGSPEPDGNWQWVTGEAFSYTNWDLPGEPSNGGINGESCLAYVDGTGGWWNDFPRDTLEYGPTVAYVVETVPKPPDLTDGLISYHPFNGNAVDATGNGHDGTVHGATLTTDRFGCSNSAYSFDGDDYIQVPHSESLNITGDITLSAWIYLNRGGDNSDASAQVIAAKTVDNGAYNNPFDFRTAPDVEPKLMLVRADASGHEYLTGTEILPLHSWQHVVVTVNDNDGNLYIDGHISGKTGDFTKPASGNSNTMYIGRRDDGLYFDGKIDNVRIYNRALSSNEVELLYNIQESCTSPPDANANGPYTIYVGDTLTLDANGSTDPDGDIVSFLWDLDDSNSFETDAGNQPVFDVNYSYLQSLGLLVNHTYTIHLKVTDSQGQSDVDDSTLTIVPKPALVVSVDIKPGSCPNPLNVKSSGILPIAILGSEDLDVNEIVPTSIQLAGVEAIRNDYEDVTAPVLDTNDCNCTKVGPDGLLDLTLKFRTAEIVEAIGEVNHGDVLQLELTGVLFGEIPIEGADCIVIRGRHKPFNNADVNKDGLVDMTDLAIIADNWLQSSIID